MTETMQKTVANITKLCNVSTKIRPYANHREDLTEIISMMHYDSKIESVISWITGYDNNEPLKEGQTETFTLPPGDTVTIEKPKTVPKMSVDKHTNINKSYADSFAFDLTDVLKHFDYDKSKAAIEAVINYNSDEDSTKTTAESTETKTETETESESEEPPIEFDKEFISYATYPDLDTETASKVIENYDKQKWLKQDKAAEWRRNEQYPLMVSDSGLFFDLIENKPIVPYWHAGEMFLDITVDAETLQKRCGVMIATVFNLKRPPVVQNDTNVVDFKDNDRRNLRLDNLCYSRKSLKPSNTTLLLNDVCQRCIEYNFSAAKVASLYDGNDEIEITVDFVKELINKKQRNDISDNYWKLDSHRKPVPVTPKLPSTSFVDVATVFIQGDSIENCEILLDSKIAGNYALSDAEKELLCNLAKKALPSTGVTYSNIAVYIVNNYKWEISANEVKRLMNNPTAVTQRFAEISANESEAS